MTTSIARDTFIQSLVTSLNRELYIETEDHVRFPSYAPLILLHVWREGEEYVCGFSERLSGPSTEIWANSLTPIKQWLVMDNVDVLRWHLGLERFGIRFRNLLIAPHWSHRPGTNDYSVELCHDDQPTNIFTGKWSKESTNLSWFLNHSPDRLLEIAHIESTKEACQALFGMPRVPFAKPTDTRQEHMPWEELAAQPIPRLVPRYSEAAGATRSHHLTQIHVGGRASRRGPRAQLR